MENFHLKIHEIVLFCFLFNIFLKKTLKILFRDVIFAKFLQEAFIKHCQATLRSKENRDKGKYFALLFDTKQLVSFKEEAHA